jgi:hypothetical protein
VAVAIAGVAFVEVAAAGVSNGSHTDPLAAFAPGLLAFGVGVLAARLLPLTCRWAIALTRHSRRVATALAVRRLGRRAGRFRRRRVDRGPTQPVDPGRIRCRSVTRPPRPGPTRGRLPVRRAPGRPRRDEGHGCRPRKSA